MSFFSFTQVAHTGSKLVSLAHKTLSTRRSQDGFIFVVVNEILINGEVLVLVGGWGRRGGWHVKRAVFGVNKKEPAQTNPSRKSLQKPIVNTNSHFNVYNHRRRADRNR